MVRIKKAKTIKISSETYDKIVSISLMEKRFIKAVVERAIDFYQKQMHKQRGW